MNFFNKLGDLLGFSNKFMGMFSLYRVGDSGQIWLQTDKPYHIYMEIPQLPIVVNRIAKMTANGIWKIKDKEGNEIDTPEANAIIKRLQNPSVFETENDYIENSTKHLGVYGNSFIKKNQPSKLLTVPLSLMTLSPRYLQPDLTGKLYNQLKFEDAVKGYQYDDTKTRDYFKTNEIIWIKYADIDNPLIGKSPIEHLKYPLSNIKEAYSYRNAIMAKKGALGFISSEAKDEAGTRAWGEVDRREFEREYFNKYGHGHDNLGNEQSPFMTSRHPIKFTPTSYPTKEMQLFEEVDVNLSTICQLYGLSTNMFDTKTTFENLKNGIIQSYQDCIFPNADKLAQAHHVGLNLPEEWELQLDYSHIELLKESKLRGAQAMNQGLAAINQALTSGLIDSDTAQSASMSLISAVI